MFDGSYQIGNQNEITVTFKRCKKFHFVQICKLLQSLQVKTVKASHSLYFLIKHYVVWAMNDKLKSKNTRCAPERAPTFFTLTLFRKSWYTIISSIHKYQIYRPSIWCKQESIGNDLIDDGFFDRVQKFGKAWFITLDVEQFCMVVLRSHSLIFLSLYWYIHLEHYEIPLLQPKLYNIGRNY